MNLESPCHLAKHFMPHQLAWINAEHAIHAQHKQVVALAEKSVCIGWTYADAFKNVRKRLWFKERDYLFATKDYPSALEYVRQCYKFEMRSASSAESDVPSESSAQSANSEFRTPHSALRTPWNIYFRVTLVDAIHNGLADTSRPRALTRRSSVVVYDSLVH